MPPQHTHTHPKSQWESARGVRGRPASSKGHLDVIYHFAVSFTLDFFVFCFALISTFKTFQEDGTGRDVRVGGIPLNSVL